MQPKLETFNLAKSRELLCYFLNFSMFNLNLPPFIINFFVNSVFRLFHKNLVTFKQKIQNNVNKNSKLFVLLGPGKSYRSILSRLGKTWQRSPFIPSLACDVHSFRRISTSLILCYVDLFYFNKWKIHRHSFLTHQRLPVEYQTKIVLC